MGFKKEVFIKFGELLYSIEMLQCLIDDFSGACGKGHLIGITNLCDLLNKDFQNSLNKLTNEEETKIDSEMEHLFDELKKLEALGHQFKKD